MTESDIAISVDHVSKSFRLPQERAGSVKSLFTTIFKSRNRVIKIQSALKDVSFQVKRGEFFGIVGRNGSGKSTLLKMLAGIYQPTEGTVSVEGKLVPFIELGVGFNPELTGRQNVYLNGALLGFSEKEISDQYDDIVEFAELEQFMDQKLKNYSSGMQVRLAFSMAVRAKADVLLIDEVLAVGDADFQRKCFAYFSKLRNEKITVVFVSHNMDAVKEYCDRAMLIEKNMIVDIGATDKIAEKYMRLFAEESKAKITNNQKPEDRWGDQKMKTVRLDINVTPKTIEISQQVEAKENFKTPVAGFRIRDASGKEITGTNTKKEQFHFANLVAGERVTLTWSLPNLLSDGEYIVDPSLLYMDEITVSDWWNDAARFVIRKNRHLPYAIDPGFEVKSTKN